MSSTLAPTTLLGAVNELLTAIGTVPVNTLDAPGSSDVAIARDTIVSISREVQSRGWWFNTSYGRSFSPSGAVINIPPEILMVRPSRGTSTQPPESRQFVLRGGQLYNIQNGSNNFTTTVRADIVTLLDFNELPESARRYVTVRAARVFQTKVLGDDQLGVFTENHEDEAWQILQADHAESNPVSDMFMQRVRRMGRMMRPDPVTQRSQNRQQQRGS